MFNKKKKTDKELEFKIYMIQEIDTLKLQNLELMKRLNDLADILHNHIKGGFN